MLSGGGGIPGTGVRALQKTPLRGDPAQAFIERSRAHEIIYRLASEPPTSFSVIALPATSQHSTLAVPVPASAGQQQ
jgi:hypothetical protein